jgi:hypothetical protein
MSIAYRLRVGGSLDPSWSDRLGGLHIEHRPGTTGACETMLEGHLEDQAALAGVLNTLFELMVPILSAERLDPGAVDSTAPASSSR